MSSNFKRTQSACYWGASIQAISLNLFPLFFATLQNDYGITFEKLGRLVLVTFAVQIVVDFLSLFLVQRWGYRTCFVSAHVLTAAGYVLFAFLPRILPNAYVGMTLATIVYSIGAGFLEVIISPMSDAIPIPKSKTALMLVHAFYPLGQVLTILITTIAIWFVGRDLWWAITLVWAIVPLSNAIRGMTMPYPEVLTGAEHHGYGEIVRSPLFVSAMVLMICAGATEQAMAQWASLFAEKALGVDKLLGDLLGPCFFALCMGLGRFWNGVGGSGNLSLRRLLTGCAICSILCYLVTALVPVPIVALLGCAFCGLTVSLMWPGTMTLIADRMGHSGTFLFIIMALAGDIGCSVGPWLTGLVSDLAQIGYTGADPAQYGLRSGLLVTVVFPVVMLALLIFLPKNIQKNRS